MKLKQSFLLFCFCLCHVFLQAQLGAFSLKYSSSGNFLPFRAAMNQSGDVFSVGSHLAGINSTGNVYVQKTDHLGNVIWGKVADTGEGSYPTALTPTPSGGVIVVGRCTHVNPSANYRYALEMDSIGGVLWAKRYLISGANGLTTTGIQKVLVTSDGHIILAGGVNDSNGRSGFIAQADSVGNLQWTRRMEFSGWSDNIQDIIENKPGVYTVLGTVRNSGPLSSFVASFDSVGNLLSSRFLRSTRLNMADLEATGDGGFIIAGEENYKPTLIKVDSTGDIEWGNWYAIPSGGGGYESVAKMANGEYVALQGPDLDYEGSLIRIDAGGEMISQKGLELSGEVTEHQMMLAPDESLYLHGLSFLNISRKGMLLKTNSDAAGICAMPKSNVLANPLVYSPEEVMQVSAVPISKTSISFSFTDLSISSETFCESPPVPIVPVELDESYLGIFPNPAIEKIFVKSDHPEVLVSQVEIYNVQGRLASRKEIRLAGNTVEVGLDGLTPGVYMVGLRIGGEIMIREKVLVLGD